MPMFVNLTAEKNKEKIRRAGLKTKNKGGLGGIFAMPVLRDFYASHQWLRELKRKGQRTLCGIYFRIPDQEIIEVGHYLSASLSMTAAEAAALISKSANKEGYQVLIRRNILPKEIHKIRSLSQVLGWRYYPEAHGHKPCGCLICLRPGEIKSRKIRQRFGRPSND